MTGLFKQGKRTVEWLRARKLWLKLNPPDHTGHYVCGICGRTVHYTDMEVDHVEGRVGGNLVDLENLQPSHIRCNRLKGSKRVAPNVSKTEYELRRTLDL